MYMTARIQSPVAKAVERLVEQYQTRLCSVVQLGEHTVRGRLNDGCQVTAVVMPGDAVEMWELEEAC